MFLQIQSTTERPVYLDGPRMGCRRACRGLQKLTLIYGGSHIYQRPSRGVIKSVSIIHYIPVYPSLQKLDFQGFSGTRLPSILSLSHLLALKKLYIRGGKLTSLRRREQWVGVEILHLKYSSDLRMEWAELMGIFPNLIYLLKVEYMPHAG